MVRDLNEPPAAITERKWNQGAGARPGGKSGKNDESSVWHEAAAALPPQVTGNTGAAPEDVVERKTAVAERLMEAEARAFDGKLSKTNAADYHWLQTVRRSGTSRDKIAASALVIEQNALCNIRALDELIALASKRGGAQGAAGHAVDALKELFLTVLLPDRRLQPFASRPLAAMKPSKAGDRQLLFWWMEDCVKRRYSLFVSALEHLSTGSLDWAKEKAVKAASELLSGKPELEGRLLALVVNKLGDPSRRVASNAGYLISCLLTQHPLMGEVVVREVEKFLYRPNQKARARYYAIVTLNQMVLSHHPTHGAPLAAKLIDIYFTLFQLVLDGKVGVVAERAAAAAGDGGAAGASEPLHSGSALKHKQKLKGRRAGLKPRGREGGQGKPGRSGKGGQKGAGGAGKGLVAEEVDARVLGALLTGVRRAYPYVKAGELDGVFEKHAKSVFRTVHVAPLTVAVQALMLLFQVLSTQSASSDRFYNALYAVLLRPGVDRSSSLSMLLGLLFQALKADVSSPRIAAFLKRLLQLATAAPSNVACAVLFVTSEVLKSKAQLWTAITQPEDGSDEAFRDAPEASGEDGEVPGEAAAAGGDEWPREGGYLMTKRSPQFAHAERACWWELSVLSRHVHPSVATMARTLLAGTSILYDGDPIADLTVVAFLDKFVKRKAKKADKGASVMQPVAAGASGSESAPDVAAAGKLGSAAFAALAEADVAAEDVFFHRYFTMDRVRARRASAAKLRSLKKKKKKGEEGSDGLDAGGDSEGEDEEEDESAAEDEFLEDLEVMEDDDLGDPDAGMDMVQALELEGSSDNQSDDDGMEGTTASEEMEEETEKATKEVPHSAGESCQESEELQVAEDAELEGVDMFALPSPSGSEASEDRSESGSSGSDSEEAPENDGAQGMSQAMDIGELAELADEDGSDIDAEAFERAMFGESDSSEDEERGKGGVGELKKVTETSVAEPFSRKKITIGDLGVGKKRRAGSDAKKPRKKGKGDIFADASEYADIVEKIASGDGDVHQPSHVKSTGKKHAKRRKK